MQIRLSHWKEKGNATCTADPRTESRVMKVGTASDEDAGDYYLPACLSESVGWQNFIKTLLVFGCIGSDFCKKICVLQHFSKSTRFSS